MVNDLGLLEMYSILEKSIKRIAFLTAVEIITKRSFNYIWSFQRPALEVPKLFSRNISRYSRRAKMYTTFDTKQLIEAPGNQANSRCSDIKQKTEAYLLYENFAETLEEKY